MMGKMTPCAPNLSARFKAWKREEDSGCPFAAGFAEGPLQLLRPIGVRFFALKMLPTSNERIVYLDILWYHAT